MKKNLFILFFILLYINKIHSQSNWELLNPLPTANNGVDIDFVSNDIGYIITSKEILETLDAGVTWVKKQSISSGNDMSFYNTTGYIVGNFGYVLKSIDNGTSWNQISTGFNNSFNTVNIIDDNNIILSTSNSIIKTNDGGTTWESLSIPNTAVNKSFFTSSLVGHAVCDNGTILKTIDGGQNWYVTQSTSVFPSDYFTVYFVNESVGFTTREHNDIFKTIDGGETWVEISSPGNAMFDYHFLDENIGFATGEFGATYKTNDSGNTWNPIFYGNGLFYGNTMHGIYFQDSNIGFATGAHGRIIKTIDGGNTWNQYSPTYNDLGKLEFTNSNIAYAAAGRTFFKTTDGGNTWFDNGQPNINSEYSISYFDFINENIGFAYINGTVYKTEDGGINWIGIITNSSITYIHFMDENIGFVGGGVIKTTDGGNTWTTVNSSINFRQIQFMNNQVGYGIGIGSTDGILYKSTDGGSTWEINIELDDDNINAFHFVDENNGYFVGDNALIYKTSDGGISWEELEIPYENYIKINFYSKNIGFISDDGGRLYKTENSGISWEFLTQQHTINSIEFINDEIYTAGTNGKIHRSDIEYETIHITAIQAENISNSNATLIGNVATNGESITDIQFQYSTDYSFNNILNASPNTINANDSSNVSVDIVNLDPNTLYYYRLLGTHNSNVYTSQVLNFTTLQDYDITTNFSNDYTAITAELSGNIISNGNDITNIEFEYGLSSDALNNSVSGTPTIVLGNSAENISANLDNLEPETQYFYRLKATHQGEDIYGNIQSFTTYPEYNISIFNPDINGTDATLSATLRSYSQGITDIEFEYGTIDYEYNSIASPSFINDNGYSYVTTTITNLDTNLNYYYRLKGIHNGEAIYSEEGVFNLSGDIIIVNGTIEETQANSLELRGLINSSGAVFTNIHFEYGITENFGSTINGSPSYVSGYSTKLIIGLINNPIPNQTYFYRLVATNNGNTIYSDTYQHTTGTLGIPNFNLENNITIYPNPATDFLNINSNNSKKITSIKFYDVLGKLLYNENISHESNIKIDISNFRKGIYFLKVNLENFETLTAKLILN